MITNTISKVAVSLSTKGFVDEALLLLEAAKQKVIKDREYYKKRARQRMDDAYDRAGKGKKGIQGTIKATEIRIKKTKDPQKLLGIVDAITDFLEQFKKVNVDWGKHKKHVIEQVNYVHEHKKDFTKLKTLANKKIKELSKPKD